MSGGVDSSVVCALLANQKRYHLKGVFMRNWDPLDEQGITPSPPSDIHAQEGCQWKKDWSDVQAMCKQLGVESQLLDFTKDYWHHVFSPSLDLWQKGWTPNPDVLCNRYIKFGAFLQAVLSIAGPSQVYLATGHYARKTVNADGQAFLTRGIDPKKDQSYYLSSITQDSLRHAFFPLGDYTKPEIRRLASNWNLPTASRPESMGICFVGEKRRFHRFLANYLPPQPGPIVDAVTHKTIGAHQGLWNFTIGENARIPGQRDRLFVSSKDPTTNAIFVVNRSDHPLLHFSHIEVEGFHWINQKLPPLRQGARVKVQFRYRSEAVWGQVRSRGEEGHAMKLHISLDEPQVALAEGQIVVLYDTLGDENSCTRTQWFCMGHGMVSKVSPKLTDQLP